MPSFAEAEQEDPSRPLLPLYLDYFNLGGSPSRLPRYYKPKEVKDLTADGIPEVVLEGWQGVFILGCHDGQYKELLSAPNNYAMWPPFLWLSEDANRNGVPELVIEVGSATQGGADFRAFEWDGLHFASLLASSDLSPFRPFAWEGIYGSQVVHPEFLDIDLDGRKELVFVSLIPVWTIYRDGLPWRVKSDVYEWDGAMYVPHRSLYSVPEYRFQAVQDGDRFTLFGEYDQALAAYQEAIFSDKLGWWSPDRQINLQEIWDAEAMGGTPTPTPPPPDPPEYYYLEAYARFRIMLLHLIRGWQPEAETVYKTLLQEFPPGTPGSEVADLASAFMQEYTLSASIPSACDALIQLATQQTSPLLNYLGELHHGWQSPRYRYELLCPFGVRYPLSNLKTPLPDPYCFPPNISLKPTRLADEKCK